MSDDAFSIASWFLLPHFRRQPSFSLLRARELIEVQPMSYAFQYKPFHGDTGMREVTASKAGLLTKIKTNRETHIAAPPSVRPSSRRLTRSRT